MDRIQKNSFGGALRVLAVALVILISLGQPNALIGLAIVAAAWAGLAEWRKRQGGAVASLADAQGAEAVIDEAPVFTRPQDFITAMGEKYGAAEEAAAGKAKTPQAKPKLALAAIAVVAVVGGGAAIGTQDTARDKAMQAWQTVSVQASGFVAKQKAAFGGRGQDGAAETGVAETGVAETGVAETAVAAVAPEVLAMPEPEVVVMAAQSATQPAPQVAAKPAPQTKAQLGGMAVLGGFVAKAKHWAAIFWATPQFVLGAGVMFALAAAVGLLVTSRKRDSAALNQRMDPFDRLLQRRLQERGREAKQAAPASRLLRA